MITNLMNLLNATNITISATKANELYQVVIVADNASEITITGNKDEIDNDLEKVIIDNIEAILKAKKQKMTAKVKPVQQEVKKPKSTNPTKISENEEGADTDDDEITQSPDDSESQKIPQMPDLKEEKNNLIPPQGSLF